MSNKKIAPRLDFLSPLSCVPGLGSKRIAALNESGIETIGNLLYHFPRRYVDRSEIIPVAKLPEYIDKSCAVIGTITRTQVERGKRPRFRIQVTDVTGSFEAIWFHGIPIFRKSLLKGKRILLYGKVGKYVTCQMFHPLVETISANKSSADIPFLPQYPLTGSMRDARIQQKAIFNAIHWVLKNLKHYPQILPQKIEKKKSFPSLETCLHAIHIPTDPESLDPYFNRLRYEELFQLAITLRWSKRKFALPGRCMGPGDYSDTFRKSLHFTLTDEQEKAIQILFKDAASPQRMHRMLQGDVGSGKTVVAFFACLPALNEGLQVAWLAPTEVLARQTYQIISKWLKVFNIEAGLLKGGMSSSQKREVLAGLNSKKLSFVVGTHALLQPSVTFSKLGMIVIDEQHKFGAEQRLIIQQKDSASDFLLMSATPIPQSLAKTLYGDLEIVTIRSIPKGRKPVKTHLVPKEKQREMESFIANELLKKASQAFWVVPRIDNVDNRDNDIKDIDAVFKNLKKGSFARIPVEAIHGKVDGREKERVMNEFTLGNVKMIVATTVIEVGIDVPDATIMVVENAERFGLSQLHQLRGRVGRGNNESFIFLLTGENPGDKAKERLQRFCKIHNGFEIADLDLKLRGPGEVAGFKQSGWDELHIADILEDADTFREIQEELDALLIN